MFSLYRKSLIECLELLHQARKDPFKDPLKWRYLQEKLIRRLFYIESRIREDKEEIKEINKLRKHPTDRLTKEESNHAKGWISYLEYRIDEYHRLLECFKSIGDGIAYTFISRYDIKPQVFKEDPGFISGKIGFRAEKRLFNQIFNTGAVAILHDLTSVLRYRDLTIIDNDGYIPVEVKTSTFRNQRALRQQENSEKLFEYLGTDRAEGLFGIDKKMRRVQLLSEEKNHIRLLNRLIKKSAVKKGMVVSLAEKGLMYGVGREEDDNLAEVTKMITNHGFSEAVVHFLNMSKFDQGGYYPFILSIIDPEDYVDFLEGKLGIFIVFDQNRIREIALEHGYQIFSAGKEMTEFKAIKPENGVASFQVSSHYLNRLTMEFNSLQWMFEEMFTRINSSLVTDLEGKAEKN